ncbi:AhpC/TSA family protein [Flavobacterium plurextorum]|uniref:peroxiredoxin-like family protein n=1 Tax=Flavobacterium TaxID=237 RepID=UPI00214DC450|nr:MULTISPECIES: peroxiredoxin-like family protein [Flavobacterium]UUW08407.1 AhpC/TSA family protein [Flavobacterium plurextorum]
METMKNKNHSLEDQLKDFKKNWSSKVDQSVSDTFQKGIDELVEANFIANAVKKGDKSPSFSLMDASGKAVSLEEKLKKGRVILTWYRGGWCPYCNLTLRSLQSHNAQFNELNAQLIALTPELPDNSLSTKEKNELTFDVLSDIDNKVAKEFGLVFKVTEEVNSFYKKFHDLKDFNGGSGDELPLTATYIIEQNGEISYSFIDVDYRKRAEPQAIINQLKK